MHSMSGSSTSIAEEGIFGVGRSFHEDDPDLVALGCDLEGDAVVFLDGFTRQREDLCDQRCPARSASMTSLIG